MCFRVVCFVLNAYRLLWSRLRTPLACGGRTSDLLLLPAAAIVTGLLRRR